MMEAIEMLLNFNYLHYIGFAIILGIIYVCKSYLSKYLSKWCNRSNPASTLDNPNENIALNTQNQEDCVSIESSKESLNDQDQPNKV